MHLLNYLQLVDCATIDCPELNCRAEVIPAVPEEGQCCDVCGEN